MNVYTSNHLCCIKIRAEPLPIAVTNLLEKSTDILRALSEQKTENISEALECLTIEDSVSKNRIAINTFQSQLQEALGNNMDVSQIWAFGPRKCGPNILLNKIPSKCILFIIKLFRSAKYVNNILFQITQDQYGIQKTM